MMVHPLYLVSALSGLAFLALMLKKNKPEPKNQYIDIEPTPQTNPPPLQTPPPPPCPRRTAPCACPPRRAPAPPTSIRLQIPPPSRLQVVIHLDDDLLPSAAFPQICEMNRAHAKKHYRRFPKMRACIMYKLNSCKFCIFCFLGCRQ